MLDVTDLLHKLTTEEKVALVSGTNFMETNPIPRLNIPNLYLADGPHGLRKQVGTEVTGIAKSHPSTAFPTAACVANSWNPDNSFKLGQLIAKECRHYGVHVLLGPGLNIKRNPLCGRNFEYFSEDPLLSGSFGSAQTKGVQSEGVAVSVKHLAVNNSENYRFMGDSIADERAIREIYLKSFEMIVKEAKPYTIMSSYNKLNGTYTSEHPWLLNDVTRKDWGFDGLFMTDWGATHDRVKAVKAGMDLEMPGDTAICRRQLLDALHSGRLTLGELDAAVTNVLNLINRVHTTTNLASVDWSYHHTVAAEIAADSAVLLKNDGSLPLKSDQNLLIVGDLFTKMRYQGAGSSLINATKVTSPQDAFDEAGIRYRFSRGYASNQLDPDDALVQETLAQVTGNETIVSFIGLTDFVETEGDDRPHMKLPDNQLALMQALIKTGRPVIVVLFGGSVVELPFEPEVSAILYLALPGQNGGTATRQLLFGEKNPSGKLSETWPLKYSDVPFHDIYSRSPIELYKESILVGYRYYLSADKPVRYPFGHGLSYTSFRISDSSVTHEGDIITVKVAVENLGQTAGAEVMQLYVTSPKNPLFMPKKELRGFTKVYLEPGEAKEVVISFTQNNLTSFHPKLKRFVLPGGTYTAEVCTDALMVHETLTLEVGGEEIPEVYSSVVYAAYQSADISKITDSVFAELLERRLPKAPPIHPFTLETRFTDLKSTFFGRRVFNTILKVADQQDRKANRLPEGSEKDNMRLGAMFLRKILESNSFYSLTMCGGKQVPFNMAEGLVHLANGQFIRGLKKLRQTIDVPPLPKDTKVKTE